MASENPGEMTGYARRNSSRFPDIQNPNQLTNAKINQKKIRRKPDSELALPGQSSPTKLPAPFERTGYKRDGAADSSKGDASPNIMMQQKAGQNTGAQQATTQQHSDRQSDNDSNASSGGMVSIKKVTKNKE